MSSYYDQDFKAATLSLEELNTIALKGGIVGRLPGLGYARQGDTPEYLHGYGFKWIRTFGMGNSGTLTLTPRSKEAFAYLQEGRCRAMMERYSLTYVEALALDEARYGVQYGMEQDVMDYVIKTMDCYYAWKYLAPNPGRKEIYRWVEEWSMPLLPEGMSIPRFQAVREIVSRLK